ncbi:Ubiquitin carboxyl-terminal hydrolase isozyme L3 [Acropora cervicornis]|uniref:Ubiquitin carboxyl-terminal hydrolase n=1 Tax=Acropora cervicornis TaxID=6130 RepID=A0AAD9V6Z8_ACRCE|nr:Ubiquitin carboxyl-terminal hydrolase isozyme L3 [Acropora cervicornis]
MNKFVTNLGLKPTWSFVDVFGLDPELLAILPQPTCALLLLFPTSDKYRDFKKEQEEKVLKDGQEVSPNVFFMKQTIGNACGTIAIIHAIANNADVLDFDQHCPGWGEGMAYPIIACAVMKDGFLKTFIESTKSLSPEEKGARLEADESISVAHEASAQEGQTEAPSAEARVDLHFVAIVHKDGCLYELASPWKDFKIFNLVWVIDLEKSTSDKGSETLKDAAEVCKEYMRRDPLALNFTVVALSSTL